MPEGWVEHRSLTAADQAAVFDDLGARTCRLCKICEVTTSSRTYLSLAQKLGTDGNIVRLCLNVKKKKKKWIYRKATLKVAGSILCWLQLTLGRKKSTSLLSFITDSLRPCLHLSWKGFSVSQTQVGSQETSRLTPETIMCLRCAPLTTRLSRTDITLGIRVHLCSISAWVLVSSLGTLSKQITSLSGEDILEFTLQKIYGHPRPNQAVWVNGSHPSCHFQK